MLSLGDHSLLTSFIRPPFHHIGMELCRQRQLVLAGNPMQVGGLKTQ